MVEITVAVASAFLALCGLSALVILLRFIAAEARRRQEAEEQRFDVVLKSILSSLSQVFNTGSETSSSADTSDPSAFRAVVKIQTRSETKPPPTWSSIPAAADREMQTEIVDYLLPINSGDKKACVGETLYIPTPPLMEGNVIGIKVEDPDLWEIEDIRIGNATRFGRSARLPASLLPATDVSLGKISTGQDLVIVATRVA